jgi:hypothetical protein
LPASQDAWKATGLTYAQPGNQLVK